MTTGANMKGKNKGVQARLLDNVYDAAKGSVDAISYFVVLQQSN